MVEQVQVELLKGGRWSHVLLKYSIYAYFKSRSGVLYGHLNRRMCTVATHGRCIQCINYQKWVLKKQYLEDREIMEHFKNNFKYSKNIRFWRTSLLYCHSSRVFITDHYSPTRCTVMTMISVFSQCWSLILLKLLTQHLHFQLIKCSTK